MDGSTAAPSATDLPRGYQNNEGQHADPTAQTVAALDKAVACLREIYDARLIAVDARFSAIDEATRIMHDDMVRVPTLLDRATQDLRTLFDVKLDAAAQLRIQRVAAVDMRFAERDRYAEKTAKTSDDAIAAALTSAKELVSVQNTHFAAQVSDLKTSFSAQITGLDGKFTDLKDRFNQLGGALTNEQQSRSNRRADIGPMTGIVAAGVAILMFLGTMGALLFNNRPQPQPQIVYAPPSAAASGGR